MLGKDPAAVAHMHFACLRETAMEKFDFKSLEDAQHASLLRAVIQRDTLALTLQHCDTLSDDMLKSQLPDMPYLLSL